MEGCDYEVFLSFRGTDTRKSFTDHLYNGLRDAGVKTFKDDVDLSIGEEISRDLPRAIGQSKISIPIFSKNYASSRWCLKELAQMVECRKRKGQIIMPIFFDVEPSELRHQTRDYGKALLVHENDKRVDDETIHKWRAALKEVGGLTGWNKENVANGHEGQLVKQVVTRVLNELKKAYLVVSEFLVGVDNSVKAVLGMMGTDTNDTKIVGIRGMGGIGKTTLAKVVYNKLSSDFANYCFLSDVRETSDSKGIVWLQTQLISNLSKQALPGAIDSIDSGINIIETIFVEKKVLILLDDVDEKNQLIALLGRQVRFGPGSRILITTRNEIILREFRVKLIYLVNGLDAETSLQLFSKHVFRRDHPPREKMEQSREIVKIAQGLPLILEVMGSTLSIHGQTEEMWEDYLVKWRTGQIGSVRSTLMISYKALDPYQAQIFLDIACFFEGYDKSRVIYMWKDYNLCPREGLEVLQLMSLIKITNDDRLWMHDQLKDLGRYIVSQESGGKIYKQSRLWNHKDPLKMLLREKRNAKLEGLYLKLVDGLEIPFILEGFAVLPNLRFLQVDRGWYFYGKGFFSRASSVLRNFTSQVSPVLHNLSQASLVMQNLITSPLDHLLSKNQLLPNLRWLSWQNFPWRTLKLENFSLDNLVILDFSSSTITHDWDGWIHIKRAKKLKVLDLSACRYLTKTPNFSGLLMLERLALESCFELNEVDSSIGQLWRLVFLNLRGCEGLSYLPKELVRLPSLAELLLDGTNIQEIPDWCGMENLEDPHVQISQLAEPGDSLNCLSSMLMLSLDRTLITHLPDSIGALTNLKRLSLMGCSQIETLPYSIKELQSLTELDLSHIGLTDLPDSMESLENLKALKLCSWNTTNVSSLPKLPKSLTSLAFLSLRQIAFPDLSNLINLKLLLLYVAMVHEIPGPSELVWIGRLSELEVLALGCQSITNLPPELGALPHLKTLQIFNCFDLACIPLIPSSVTKLHIGECRSLTALDISNLKNLSDLYVFDSPVKDLYGHELSDNLVEGKINGLDLSKPKKDIQHLRRKFMKMVYEQHGLKPYGRSYCNCAIDHLY